MFFFFFFLALNNLSPSGVFASKQGCLAPLCLGASLLYEDGRRQGDGARSGQVTGAHVGLGSTDRPYAYPEHVGQVAFL